MKGFFISEENAKELGLLKIKSFSKKSQKTIIIVTEKDILEYREKAQLPRNNFNNKKIKDMSIWFYRNYYETLMETLNEF